MLIDKIIKIKNGSYKIVFDDGVDLITYDDVILKYNLLYKKKISDDIMKKIVDDNEYYNLLNKCIKYISKKYRSEFEIRTYLSKKTLNTDLIFRIITELKGRDYINDFRFARAFINDKLTFSNNGILKIKDDLLALGVSEHIINDIVDNINLSDDLDKLEKIILKKIRNNHKYSNNMLKQKIIYECINLGYNREDIINIFDKNITDDNDIYLKEYNKIYNKFKDKYNGSELDFYVKQKMSAKGFKKN